MESYTVSEVACLVGSCNNIYGNVLLKGTSHGMKEVKHTTRAASMLSLRRSASVPVTVVPLALVAFFFTTALDTGALGATRT